MAITTDPHLNLTRNTPHSTAILRMGLFAKTLIALLCVRINSISPLGPRQPGAAAVAVAALVHLAALRHPTTGLVGMPNLLS